VLNRFFIQLLGFNRAVFISLILKCWQAGAGLVGLFLISIYIPIEVQGFYYTFASLVALQSFFELGLYQVISNVASHEWSKLRLSKEGSIEGDPQALSRLVSLGRFVFKWYAVVALVFFIFAGGGGFWFLGNAQASEIDWKIPWLVHIAFSSLLLLCMPFVSLLEGCEQVAQLAEFRIWQSMASNISFWAAILTFSNLWAAPALSSISALFCIYYLVVRQRNFFRPFLKSPLGDYVDWKGEILPMQWRLALQSLMHYFVNGLFTPVMFHYHGPVVAGQMGMSLQLISAVQSIASIWISSNAPRFAILIARREFRQLDAEWRKATILAVSMMLVGVGLLLGFLHLINLMHLELASRVMSPFLVSLLALGAVFSLWGSSFSMYLRAHKREVLLMTGILSGIVMGLLVWKLGSQFGLLGATASFLFVTSCVSFPMVFYAWKKARHEWH
jgi:O-antigen/teichoic acid export membrane protein